MAESPFVFLRATYYRWIELFPKVCRKLMDSPYLTAVGDLHIENFGSWRDREGRLVWEAKAWLPSAAARAARGRGKPAVALMRDSVRSPDPVWTIQGSWVVRRLERAATAMLEATIGDWNVWVRDGRASSAFRRRSAENPSPRHRPQ